MRGIAIKPRKTLQNLSAILVAALVRNAANAAADRAPCAPTDPSANLKALLVPVLHSSHSSVIGVADMVHLRFHGMLSRADPAGPRITLFVGSGDVNGQMQVRRMLVFRLCQRSKFMTGGGGIGWSVCLTTKFTR